MSERNEKVLEGLVIVGKDRFRIFQGKQDAAADHLQAKQRTQLIVQLERWGLGREIELIVLELFHMRQGGGADGAARGQQAGGANLQVLNVGAAGVEGGPGRQPMPVRPAALKINEQPAVRPQGGGMAQLILLRSELAELEEIEISGLIGAAVGQNLDAGPVRVTQKRKQENRVVVRARGGPAVQACDHDGKDMPHGLWEGDLDSASNHERGHKQFGGLGGDDRRTLVDLPEDGLRGWRAIRA